MLIRCDIFKIMMYLCIANKEEKASAVKPGLFYFNYWKRTKKAGCGTGLFYCVVGRWGMIHWGRFSLAPNSAKENRPLCHTLCHKKSLIGI